MQARVRLVGDLRVAPKLELRERRDTLLINVVDEFAIERTGLSILHLAIQLRDRIVKIIEQLLSARSIRCARGALQIVQLAIVERQQTFQQVLGVNNRILEGLHETLLIPVPATLQIFANSYNFIQPLFDLIGFLLQSGLGDVLHVVQVLRVNSNDESVA